MVFIFSSEKRSIYFCLRDSPVHQVAADTDTKLLPEHAGQIVFTDKKMLCQKIQAYFLLIMLIQVLLYRKYILFFKSASLCFSPGCQDSFIRSVSR